MVKEKEAKARADKKRKHEYVTQKKSVWAGIELPPIGLSHWAYTTRVLTTSGRLLLTDHVQTGTNFCFED